MDANTGDIELRFLLSVSRRLPRTRGAGVLGRWLIKLYLRKVRKAITSDILGFRMELDPKECVDAELLFYPQLYDRHEIEFARANLGYGDVFVDVGAHIGFYSLMASRQVGVGGRVVAIEADPHSYRRLVRNVERNGFRNVDTLRAGASDRHENVPLFVNMSGNRGGSTFLPDGSAVPGAGIEVSCRPLLSILTGVGVARVDGMKLDIEGMEYRVLKRYLAEAPPEMVPRFLVVEYQPGWVERAGGDAIALLESYGYRTKRRTRLNYLMTCEDERRPIPSIERVALQRMHPELPNK